MSTRSSDDTNDSGREPTVDIASDRAIEPTVDLDAPPPVGEIGPARGDAATIPLSAAPAVSQWLTAAINPELDLPVVEREHYSVMAEHARGGLGRILKARDLRTGRIVAIKEMLTKKSDSLMRRFAREALITANLQHPAIVPVYELGRWQTGELFYVMKFVVGRSLKDVIKACTTLDERLARLPIVLSVAEAIAYAHSKRVIHRDLKPSNVLVGDHGETVVIDWGLAKSIGDPDDASLDPIVVPESIGPVRTMAGAVMGTPSYMPPEQARGEATDERSDVYQIGALLYHLIAGVPPYHGRTSRSSKELIRIVATEAARPLVEREPGAPPDLATIVAKAMARTPGNRYANAGELSEDLRRFTTGQLVRSHHYNRRTLVRRWLRRNRAPLTVGIALAAALVGFATWSISRIVAERDLERQQRALAETETRRAEQSLATALFEKGRSAEGNEEWARAAMYYAAARRHHDTPESAWAAGLAEARAVIPQARHEGHTAWVRGAAISPDGERAATVDEAGRLRVWSPRDGHLIAASDASTRALYSVAFSPDGRELATAGDDGVIVRMSIDLQPIGKLEGHVGRVWSLAYSPDGSTIASAGEDKLIRLWPAKGGPPRVLAGHAQRVYSIAFSADGKQLASGSDDRFVWLWDLATGRGRARGDHKAGGIRAVTYTPTSVLTMGWDRDIRAWRTDNNETEVWVDFDVIEAAAVAPGGDVLVTVGESNAIHAWEISTHRLITTLDGAGKASAVAFSRDGRWLVTAGKHAPIVWDAAALGRLTSHSHRSEMAGLAFTPDGKQFASGARDHTVRLWDVASAKELVRISTGTSDCSDGVVALAGGDIASGCSDGTLRYWDRAGHKRELATQGWMRLSALSADGTQIATGHEAGRVVLVDVASWKIVFDKTLHAHNIYDVKYAHDGRIVTASLDDHVRVWRGPNLELDIDVRAETENGILAAALSPDGRQLAIGTQETGSVGVWDVPAGRWLVRGLGDKKLGVVWKLIYTPDGSRVVTASGDGIVRIWDARTWALPAVLDADEGPALALAVSPDGKRAVAYRSGTIVIWNLETRAIETRIGGRTRDATCKDLTTQAWSDDTHRSIVSAACAADATTYYDRLAARTRQRLENQVDVTWDWPR